MKTVGIGNFAQNIRTRVAFFYEESIDSDMQVIQYYWHFIWFHIKPSWVNHTVSNNTINQAYDFFYLSLSRSNYWSNSDSFSIKNVYSKVSFMLNTKSCLEFENFPVWRHVRRVSRRGNSLCAVLKPVFLASSISFFITINLLLLEGIQRLFTSYGAHICVIFYTSFFVIDKIIIFAYAMFHRNVTPNVLVMITKFCHFNLTANSVRDWW
jgi:hypothetical protein